jgi:hypothetical protein
MWNPFVDLGPALKQNVGFQSRLVKWKNGDAGREGFGLEPDGKAWVVER